MTRILVTGAAGFIGSHLCESLLYRGFHVRGLDAFTDFYAPHRKYANVADLVVEPAFDLVTADLLTADLAEVLDGVDAVAHLAGEPGVSTSWGPDFERYLDRNVLATHRLLAGATSAGVRRFVYASSSSVYGVIDPAGKPGEPRPASPYGVSKLAAETLVGAYATTFGLSALSLRYFSVYGPRQRPDMAAHRFIEALLDGRPLTLFGDGRQVRDFTHVDDVVAATVQALVADPLPPVTVLDVASSSPVEISTLIGTLRDLVGAAAVGLDERSERPGDVPRTEGRITAAREHLGWAPVTDLRTGLARQVDWHRALRADTRQALDGRPGRDDVGAGRR